MIDAEGARPAPPPRTERRPFAALLTRWKERPLEAAITLGAVAASAFVVFAPFTTVEYPPITDLPFHAAGMSILRHYFDSSYHFREQFALHFLKTPYWTLHCLGALFAVVMPITWAAKLASVVMLAFLPIGASVMFHGMKKSPYLGLLALPFAWNKLTHWGFLNFMGAIGLFAMTIGLTFIALDRPSRRNQIALAASLVLVFGTHIFRFPFAFGAVPGIALVMYPATRRLKPALLPMIPAAILFVVWLFVRSREVSADAMEPLRLHPERIQEIGSLLFGSFVGPEERELAERTYRVFGALWALLAAIFVAQQRWKHWTGRQWAWVLGSHLAVFGIAGACFVLFLTLPMQIGISWWYVYPREIVSTFFIALGLFPNLPRVRWAQAVLLAPVAATSIAQAAFVATKYHEFDAVTADFDRILDKIPAAPRLGYMVFDHGGSNRADTPFIHMPAWVQAKKGGWLSFHFVVWKVWPIWYREGSPAVPPDTPPRFEWMPETFDLTTRGKFFDTFLVRTPWNPSPRFAVDPSLELVAHEGTWWLFRRRPGGS